MRATSGAGSGVEDNRVSSATAATAAEPPKSMHTKSTPEPSCSQRGTSELAPGSASTRVRMAAMCHMKAIPVNGTTYSPTVTRRSPWPPV